MSTRQSTIDGLLDRLAGAGALTTRRMFGESCLYLDGTPVGLVCNDRLFVKDTAAGRELCPDLAEGRPFPGCRPYLAVDPDEIEGHSGRERIADLLRVTHAALPPFRPKPRRARAEPGRSDG